MTLALEDAENNMSTKIQITAEGITKEFNKKIYGENEDGSGGIYYDYTAKIQESAQGVTQYFESTMWGDNGTPDNPDDDSVLGKYTADYQRTAQGEVNKFKLEMYGEGGTATNPKSGSTLYAVYTQTASEWKNVLWGEGGSQSSPKEGSVIKQTKDSIETKVSKGAVASTINQTAQSVLIKAEKIDLSGYVTATTFSATNSKLTNLMAGTETATKIIATSAKVTTGTFEIGDSSNSAKLKYHGTEYYSLTVSMPGVASSFEALGYYYNSGYQSAISLNHSHSCTTNNDGTITLGGSVAAGSGGSFRIADTKAYKDGVSAAIASVTISSVDKNPNSNVTYNTGSNQYSIPLKAVASNNNSKTNTYTFYATESYSAGNTKGKSDAVSAFKNQLSVSCEAAQSDDNDGVYDAAQIKVSFYNASSSEWDSKTINNVPMYEVYNKGYSAGYDAGLDTAVSEVKNHMSVECLSAQSDNNDGIYDAAKIKVTFYDASSSGWDSKTFNNVAMWRVYNEGRDDCHRSIEVTAVQVFANGSASVTIKTTGGQTTKSVAASKVTDNHT